MNDIKSSPVVPAMPQTIVIKDQTANPGPLGLLCFALTTILLSMHNAGFFGLDSAILGMAIFYGGIGQMIAGIMEWRKNNTFATVAFVSYGCFWLSFAAIVLLPKLGLIDKPSEVGIASWLGVWGLMSFVMFICTFRLNRALQIVFFLLIITFALLCIGDLTANAGLKNLGGWFGIVLGFSAFYTGLAQVLNEVYGRVVWPLGPVVKK